MVNSPLWSCSTGYLGLAGPFVWESPSLWASEGTIHLIPSEPSGGRGHNVLPGELIKIQSLLVPRSMNAAWRSGLWSGNNYSLSRFIDRMTGTQKMIVVLVPLDWVPGILVLDPNLLLNMRKHGRDVGAVAGFSAHTDRSTPGGWKG